MFGMFGRNREGESVTRDLLVIFSTNGTADIAPITEIDGESIQAAGEVEYSVPIEDVKAFVGPRGRIFCVQATEEYISDTKRIAALERSTVLRQITRFEKEGIAAEPGKLPLGKILLLVGIVVIFIIFLAVK